MPLRILLAVVAALLLLWAAPAPAQEPPQVTYYLGENGAAIGPFGLEEAKARIRSGGGAAQPVWSSQTQRWRSAGSLPEFQALFGPPPVQYYVGEDGVSVGPMTLGLVLERIRAGTLARSQGVWKSDSQRWSVAESLPELAGAFPPAPLPPPVVEYYIGGQGSSEGPLTLQQLLARIAEGRVARAQAIWKSDTQAWTEAERLPELAGANFPAAPPPLPSVEYYVDDNGTSTGPLTEEALLTRIGAGTLARGQQIWRSDTQAWAAAESLPELQASFPPPTASSTAEYLVNVDGVWAGPMPLELVLDGLRSGRIGRSEWILKTDGQASGPDVAENIPDLQAALAAAERPQGLEYRIPKGPGVLTGPLTLAQLEDAVRSNIVSRDIEVSRSDLDGTSPAGDLPELAAALEAMRRSSYAYIDQAGLRIGPLTLTQVSALIQAGTIAPDMSVLVPSSNDPVRAADVPGQSEALAVIGAVVRGERAAPRPATELASPAAPSPTAAEYWVAPEGSETAFGPSTLEEVLAGIREGRIGPRDLVQKDDGPAWDAAETLPELQAAFQPQSAAAYYVNADGVATGPVTLEQLLARIQDPPYRLRATAWVLKALGEPNASGTVSGVWDIAANFPEIGLGLAPEIYLPPGPYLTTYQLELGGTRTGKLTLAELEDAVAAFIARHDTTVWRSDSEGATPVEALPELGPALRAARAGAYYYRDDTSLHGPMTLSMVAMLLGKGTIGSEQPILVPNTTDTIPAGDVPGLHEAQLAIEAANRGEPFQPPPAPSMTAVTYFIDRDGVAEGPFSIAEVEARLREGTVGADHGIWKSDNQAWTRAGDLPELAAALAEALSPTTAYYVDQGGLEEGPLSLEALKERVQAGTLAADQLVWSPVGQDWYPAQGLPELAEAFAAIGTAAPDMAEPETLAGPMPGAPQAPGPVAAATPAMPGPGSTPVGPAQTGLGTPGAMPSPGQQLPSGEGPAVAGGPAPQTEPPAEMPQAPAEEPPAGADLPPAGAEAPVASEDLPADIEQPAAQIEAEEPPPAAAQEPPTDEGPLADQPAGEAEETPPAEEPPPAVDGPAVPQAVPSSEVIGPAAPLGPMAEASEAALPEAGQASMAQATDPALIQTLAAIASAENPTGAAGTLVATRTCFLRALAPLTPEERAAFPADVGAGTPDPAGDGLLEAFPGLIATLERLEASHAGIGAAFEACI